MSSSTDLALLQSSLQTLLRPLPLGHSLPRSVEQQLQTTLQRDLKLRLSAGGMRKCVEQLEGLREAEVRRREKKRAREEKDEGRVRVRRDDVELQGWPRRWPGVEQGDEEARYAELLDRVRSLKRERTRKRAQLAHYSHLTSLLPCITPASISAHALHDSDSALRTALNQTAEILPGVSEELEVDWRELSQMKREKKRSRMSANDDVSSASTAGAVIMKMLERH